MVSQFSAGLALALILASISATQAEFPYRNIRIKSWQPKLVSAAASNQISQLDLIASLNILGKAKYEDHKSIFICDTWIFPKYIIPMQNLTSESTAEITSRINLELELFSTSMSNLHYTELKPIVILPVIGNEENTTRFSYTRIFDEEDLLLANVLGFRQKVQNFHCIIINVPTINIGIFNTMAPIVKKYGRPHKDLFIFNSHIKENLEILFSATMQLKEIRFKYGFLLDNYNNGNNNEDINNNERSHKSHSHSHHGQISSVPFYNSCERQEKNEHLPLFSRKCYPHISNRDYNVVCTSIKPFLHYDTITTTEQYSDGTIVTTMSEKPAGVMYSIFHEAGSRYNFTFHIEYSSYLGASGFNKNGTWYGAVGQVFSREKDIAFGVVPSYHRFPVVEPIFVTWMIRYFYIRSPPFATTWQAAFLPLNPDVWILTLGLVILMVIPVFYATAILYFKYKPRNKRPEHILIEIVDALNRILMEQSATVRHWTGTRIRILVLLWTAFCLILGTAYRAKLINFLTFLEQEAVPRTHRELSYAYDYQLFLRYMGGTAYRFMIESDDPMHKRIMKRAILINTSAETMFEALFAEKGAWLDYKINAEFAMQENATLIPSIKHTPIFTRSKDTDYVGNFGWIFKKGSPLTECFEEIVGSTIAAGLYDVWKNIDSYKIRVNSARWLKSQDNSPVRKKIETIMDELETGPKALNNNSFLGVYYLCLAGFGFGFILWIGENWYFYYSKRFWNKVRIGFEELLELVVGKKKKLFVKKKLELPVKKKMGKVKVGDDVKERTLNKKNNRGDDDENNGLNENGKQENVKENANNNNNSNVIK